MIRIQTAGQINPDALIPLAIEQNDAVDATVRAILQDVRENGDDALVRYTEKFDGARLASIAGEQPEIAAGEQPEIASHKGIPPEIPTIAVPPEEITAAYEAADPALLRALHKAADNIRAFHRRQVRNDLVVLEEGGAVLGQRITPLARVGLYVPGGTAAYPSTVLMDAIPAQIAGVDEICIVTPPQPDGSVNPAVLAAARVVGIDRVYRVGGAQAVAALAYGTKSIPRVDKIVGPGNIYVATAKRLVYGLVDIDMVAGPSEILIIADDTCDPDYVAADLLSQAEHDRLASAILVTTSRALAEEVQAALERQIPKLARADICRESIDEHGRIIVAGSLREAVEISNRIAPEHLEICTDDPFALLGLVRNAGSIFLGKNVPEALGDYYAGPNHTLPTSGTARFSSPLSVDDFIKKSSFIYYTDRALAEAKDSVVTIALHEGLTAHARSVLVRFGEDVP